MLLLEQFVWMVVYAEKGLIITNNSYTEIIKTLWGLHGKILATVESEYDIYRTDRRWTFARALLNRIEPKDEFTGLGGGMTIRSWNRAV